MIKNVINAVSDQLNEYIRIRFPGPEPKVIVSNIVGQDGSAATGIENKVICSLINIEQERHLSGGKHLTMGKQVKNPPVNLDLYLMFSSNFVDSNYAEGLRFLSLVTGFFQGKAVFTPKDTPGLASANKKITFTMFNVDLGNLSNLWGAIGAKYMPSVIYKVRMIVIDQHRIIDENRPLGGMKNTML